MIIRQTAVLLSLLSSTSVLDITCHAASVKLGGVLGHHESLTSPLEHLDARSLPLDVDIDTRLELRDGQSEQESDQHRRHSDQEDVDRDDGASTRDPAPNLPMNGYEARLETRQSVAVAGVDFNISNLQTFTGDQGGVKASPIVNSGDKDRPYAVEGDNFPDFATAYARSCDNQNDACTGAANSNPGLVSLVACATQLVACKASVVSAPHTNFQVLRAQDADNLVFCDS